MLLSARLALLAGLAGCVYASSGSIKITDAKASLSRQGKNIEAEVSLSGGKTVSGWSLSGSDSAIVEASIVSPNIDAVQQVALIVKNTATKHSSVVYPKTSSNGKSSDTKKFTFVIVGPCSSACIAAWRPRVLNLLICRHSQRRMPRRSRCCRTESTS